MAETGAAADTKAKASSVFTETTRFKLAVLLINRVDEKKFAPLIKRILSNLGEKGKRVFTAAEESQLKAVLELKSDADLDTIVDAVTYIFEQAAYSNINSAEKFAPLLAAVNIQPAKVASITSTWVDNRESFLTKLRDQTLGTPLILDDVQWRLQMTLGSHTVGKSKQLNALVNFNLVDVNKIGKANAREPVTAELSKDSLTNLYEKLEVIQKQLDALSS